MQASMQPTATPPPAGHRPCSASALTQSHRTLTSTGSSYRRVRRCDSWSRVMHTGRHASALKKKCLPSSCKLSSAVSPLMASNMCTGASCFCTTPTSLSCRRERQADSHSVLQVLVLWLASASCPAASSACRTAVLAGALAASSAEAQLQSILSCRTCWPCRASQAARELAGDRSLTQPASTSRSSSGLQAAAAKRLQTSAAGRSLRQGVWMQASERRQGGGE